MRKCEIEEQQFRAENASDFRKVVGRFDYNSAVIHKFGDLYQDPFDPITDKLADESNRPARETKAKRGLELVWWMTARTATERTITAQE